MANVYGIDLGTTYSVIATLDDNGMPQVIENQDEGMSFLASAVYFPEDSDPVVGQIAKNQKKYEQDRVVEFVKRFIGKSDAPTYEFNGVSYDPIMISTLYLKRMKAYADAQGHDVKNVVITCPAYFGNEERMATKQAGELAGLNVLNIVNEPTAAALNYCVREYKENKKIMVYDLGGGTFDITLFDFSVDDSGKAFIDIIKSGGNDRLGGIDWDDRMYEYICQKYKDDNGITSELEDEVKAKIRAEVEEAKKGLSLMPKKSVVIEDAGDRTRIDLSREEYESLTNDLVEQTMDFVRQLLSDVSIDADAVDVVLLVGGSTKMPMIKAAVEEMFLGRVRVEDPDLAVAKGAALSAALEWNETLRKISEGEVPTTPILTDNAEGDKPITPEMAGGLMINMPDHIQTDSVSDKLTRSLGPAVFYDNEYVIDNLLFVGDKIPADAENIYGTREENMAAIVVNVYENIAEDRVNKLVKPCFDEHGNPQETDPELMVKQIGEVRLNLPPNTRKNAPIKVIFNCSTTGLKVTAINQETGESAETIITTENTKTKEEMQETKKIMDSIETRGQL